jgi:hypothetical protein
LDECLHGSSSLLEHDDFGLCMLTLKVSALAVLTLANCSWICGANMFSFNLHTLNIVTNKYINKWGVIQPPEQQS